MNEHRFQNRLILVSSSLLVVLCVLLGVPRDASAQTEASDPNYRRHSIGSSLFMLMNLAPLSNPPSFYQLNYAYRLTPKDVVSVEAITWRYHAPLGIPYGSSYGSSEEAFPGSVRAFGAGVAYQRFIWKGIYSALHVLPMRQIFLDPGGEKIQSGFQLFMTLRAGYHIELLSNRFFVEPSVAATYWPINTNLPEAFQKKEGRWPNYFLFEPGLHFGVKL
jgi:hypothetical protein